MKGAPGDNGPQGSGNQEINTMTDKQIEHIIRRVADEAWEIASIGGATPAVCLAIEALSDDPETRAKLLAKLKSELPQVDADA